MKITTEDGLVIDISVSGYIPAGEHAYNLQSRANLEKYYRMEQDENRLLRAELEKLRKQLKRKKK